MTTNEMRMNEKTYIDFAAKMKWPYNALDWLWPKLDVPELVAYAKERGVGLWLWGHRMDFMTEDAIRAQLSKWSQWGIVGIKIDYFDSDSQAFHKIAEMILKIAAEYKLMVNFHGSTKPTGEQRTYPHLLTKESLVGAEAQEPLSHYLPGPDAAHNCTLPFIMNAVGPQDYTPIMLKTFPSFTTDMHQFALAVVLESHIQHYADCIDMLDNHPARSFLTGMPASWDKTLLIEGSPGRYVTIARRKGEDWYVGALCSRKPRVTRFTLDFLDEAAEYIMTVYSDGYPEDTDPVNLPTGVSPPLTDEQKRVKLLASGAATQHGMDPHAVRIYTKKVRKGTPVNITLLASGGCGIIIKKRV
jgi:alpha-glucosidase